MKRLAVAAMLLLSLSAASAAEEDPVLELGPDGRIVAERPIALRVLRLPYDLVALTAWPLSRLVFWMEDVNATGRVGDVVSAPFALFRRAPEEKTE